ncbi:hypothetical protein H2O64_13065 [Kordia sp. YSTF-M3]|uniref:Bacteriocin n=1 Tax=Kordia aestuariivivens TaxID=2759037 RepID=A0ABR7QB71_9FLAO|nr:hypothetical protein [Kordia aestuariivivens]MBC8755601.1 hypothetical protein [Kordia aestuariivivens]
MKKSLKLKTLELKKQSISKIEYKKVKGGITGWYCLTWPGRGDCHMF